MNAIPLTERQQALLDYLRETIGANGRPPSRLEIARHLGVNQRSTVDFHLRALQKKGYVRLLRGSRGIELIGPGRIEPRGLPLLGRVPAGAPREAVEHPIDRLTLDMLFPSADYLLQVQGESMKEAGILDGDYVAVKRVAEARHGEIVVARLNNEDTVKRLYYRDGRALLVPENSTMTPIAVDPGRDELMIDGVVIGVVRATFRT